MNTRAIGKTAEDQVTHYLEECGMTILARNYAIRSGEIDIIARDGAYFVFIEVKSRSYTDYGQPSEAVTRAKQKRIMRAAEIWLVKNDCFDELVRFDVVEVLNGRITHWPDAFQGGRQR